MPLDDGCRFDQHHGVEDLRPNSVKPNPKQPVGGEEPKLTRALPAQDGHLMSQRDELELQRGAAANTEREQGNEGGKKGDHAHDAMAAARKSPGFPYLSSLSKDRLGVTAHPTAEWIARQLNEACGWEEPPTYLIRDRDGAYGDFFQLVFARDGHSRQTNCSLARLGKTGIANA